MFGRPSSPSSWPAGPRIGSLAGATVGNCRGHPGSICLFCCCLRPARASSLAKAPIWSVVLGCCPASGLPGELASISGCCSCSCSCPAPASGPPGFDGPVRLLLQHAPMPTPSRTRTRCTYTHAPRVRRTVSDGIDSLAVSRGQSVRPSVPLLRSFIGASLDLLFLAICAVKSRPALSGCRSLSTCHSRQSFCYIRAVSTPQPANRPILFVCRVLALPRFLPPVDPFPSHSSIALVEGQTQGRTDTLVDPSTRESRYSLLLGLHMQGCHQRSLPSITCCCGLRCSAAPL